MFSLITFMSLALALPIVSPVERDVWDPPITNPSSSTVWTIGGTYNVTWSTSNKPVNVTNPIGIIYLRHANTTTGETELAQGFQLSSGAINVTVPTDTVPGDDYVIMLMGDSGNWSPEFTIVAQLA